MYQFLTFLTCSLSNLTWSLFHHLWLFNLSSRSCSRVYHFSWNNPVCHQMQFARSQFWGSAGWSVVCSFLLPVIMQYMHLCLCVIYRWNTWSCLTDLDIMKMPSNCPVLFYSASRGVALLLVVYCICVSCCALLACQFSSIWWFRTTPDDNAICLPLHHVSMVHHLHSGCYCISYREWKWVFASIFAFSVFVSACP